jgi:Tfp pilus assembly protein PilO
VIRRLQNLWSLAKTYPFCGICGVLSLVFALGSLGFWWQSRVLIGAQVKKQKEADAVRATLISAPQLRQELVFVRQTMAKINEVLASEENLADNINYFYNMEESSKARLDSLQPFNTSSVDTGVPYKRIPFGIKVSGTYTQVTAFIHAVETGPKLSAVTRLVLRKRPDSALVTADFTVDLLGKR